MQYLLFDTNVYLALIFPLDIWKPLVEEPLEEALEFVKKRKVKIVCPDEVFHEISNKITWFSEQINEEFISIYDELKDLDENFHRDNVLFFRKIMEHKIFHEEDLDKRNRLYYIESLILKEIKENSHLSVHEVLYNSMELCNEINVRFIGEFANYNRKFQIDRLVLPKGATVTDAINQIQAEVEKSVRSPADARILSVFIYFLREEQQQGIFVTHDFHHLLLNSLALEAVFPEVLIIRPGYVKCLL